MPFAALVIQRVLTVWLTLGRVVQRVRSVWFVLFALSAKVFIFRRCMLGPMDSPSSISIRRYRLIAPLRPLSPFFHCPIVPHSTRFIDICSRGNHPPVWPHRPCNRYSLLRWRRWPNLPILPTRHTKHTQRTVRSGKGVQSGSFILRACNLRLGTTIFNRVRHSRGNRGSSGAQAATNSMPSRVGSVAAAVRGARTPPPDPSSFLPFSEVRASRMLADVPAFPIVPSMEAPRGVRVRVANSGGGAEYR